MHSLISSAVVTGFNIMRRLAVCREVYITRPFRVRLSLRLAHSSKYRFGTEITPCSGYRTNCRTSNCSLTTLRSVSGASFRGAPIIIRQQLGQNVIDFPVYFRDIFVNEGLQGICELGRGTWMSWRRPGRDMRVPAHHRAEARKESIFHMAGRRFWLVGWSLTFEDYED